jgi:hypothetical protein
MRIDDAGRRAHAPSIVRPSVVVSSTLSPSRTRPASAGGTRGDLKPARIGDAEQLGFGRDELAEIGAGIGDAPETGLTTATDRPSPDTRAAPRRAPAGVGLGDREVGLCRS